MNPISGAILLFLLLVIALAPRAWALLALVGSVFVLTQGGGLSVAGFNMYPLRFLEAVALVRVAVRRELVWSRLNNLDWILLFLYNGIAVVWILRSRATAPQQFAAAIDPTLCYLALRGLITGPNNIRWVLRALAVILVPYTALVCLERWTGSSSFVLAGHPGGLDFRNGVPRCEGSFRHPILLGSVAASFLPLYVALALDRARRKLAIAGGVLCLILAVCSNSGGALTATATACAGWCLWPLRNRMRLMRRGMLAVVVVLGFFMKAPIWYLPYKISQVTGGGGYHRSWLIEKAWEDLYKWWPTGMEISETARWFPYGMTFSGDISGADITNQFIVFGLKAGLGAILISILVLTLAFKRLGRQMRKMRTQDHSLRRNELLLWGLGTTLVVHIVNWLGVSYFDQSWAVWLFHIAAVSSTTAVAITSTPRHIAIEPALPTPPTDSEIDHRYSVRSETST